MAVQWTKQQQKVIDLRGTNILVSAAAGSGKTAVLVERVLQKIMDPEHPVNIDQLVIVTFTQAAAGEMRERIQTAIEKAAAKQPENEHLQRQRTRIHMANISTIHSFCKTIIQNHFQEIKLEPSFRIGDDGELKLLKQDVAKQVLEEYYEQGDEKFLDFVERFAYGKNDDMLENMILSLYEFTMSYPYPDKWMQAALKQYEAQTYEQLMQSDWMKALFDHLSHLLAYVEFRCTQLQDLLEFNNEWAAYAEVLNSYRHTVSCLKSSVDYEGWKEALEQMRHVALPRGKKSCQDPQIRQEIKDIRDEIKQTLDDIHNKYFVQNAQEVLDDLHNSKSAIEMLVEVTLRFAQAFLEEKRSRNILDFNDLEHEALHILRDEDRRCVTDTAKEYGEYFDEILIDEYQDSNMIQEYLLSSVSKLPLGGYNLFMVGDAKQSIYRFRMARPELFMQKFDTYSTEEGCNRRIDLHQNFRSRREVLDSANYIFEKLMKRSLGGIEYDRDAALNTGLQFPEGTDSDYTTELLLFDKKEIRELQKQEEDGDRQEEVTSVSYEAKLIAHRIKELTNAHTGLKVLDKHTGTYRIARYGDIAILLRSTRDFDTALLEELAAEGIPAHAISREGYFDTIEIATILNYLRIVDNPRQDIPLLSILTSSLGGLSDDDLVRVRLMGEGDLYTCARSYACDGEDEKLKKKLTLFFRQLEDFRDKMHYLPIHKFICYLLDVTGYEDYVSLMPQGAQRRANIQMLVEKAAAFEKTSYMGVFQFVRYVEQLQKYQIETGEASIEGEDDNTVRVMTIHKSKGLEFPIVFVAGLGKQFNRTESSQPVVIHPSYGIGIDCVDPKSRRKNKMLLRTTVLLSNQLESMGEELRVLYVALTRAKEKMILTGGINGIEGRIRQARIRGEMSDYYAPLVSSGGFMDWILLALSEHPEMEKFAEQLGLEARRGAMHTSYPDAGFVIRNVSMEELMWQDLKEMAQEERRWLKLDEQLSEHKKPLTDEMSRMLSYQYPYEEERKIPAKVSVSELKHKYMVLDEEEEQMFEEKEHVLPRPSFLEEKEPEEASGARRGTAYHKVFECIDLVGCTTLLDTRKQLDALLEQKKIDEDIYHLVDSYKIWNFAKSDIGRRMTEAAERGSVYKEQPFVYAMPARELSAEWASDEPVMMQGIIDAFFEEEDGLVLLDYKTDYLKNKNKQILLNRYTSQMHYYKCALEDLMGKPVKEVILYSVFLDCEVPVV